MGLRTKQFQPVTKRATRGERVLGSLIPSRGLGYPGGWSQDRIEQVLHMKNWTYIAIDALACLIAQLVPNMAYVSYSKKAKEVRKNSTHQSVWRDRSLTLPEKWAIPTDVNTSRFSIPGYFAKALSVIKPHEELEPLEWDHPLRRLLENPNPVDTSFDLLYELDMFLELCGVAYLWAVPSGLVNPITGGLIPAELWVIPSHWVWPRTGGQRSEYVSPEHPFADRLIEYYEIRPWGMMGSSGVLRFPPNEVLMFNWKSPLNKIDGYSKLAAIAAWIDTEESIGKSRWSQMMNQARSEVHIEMPADFEDPDDNRIARIEAKFMAKYQGEYNYGKPMFTPAGVKVTPLSFSPTEMAYFQCPDVETECLTSDGWKTYTELTKETRIACYNDKTGKLEYHQPSRVMVSDYKGPMHQWKSQDVDILVTPGHRMLTMHLDKAGTPLTGDWRIDRIRNLSSDKGYRVKTTAPMETQQPEFVEIPMFKKYAKGEPAMVGKYQIDVGDWARFLGWYVSEGHISKQHDFGFNDAGKKRRRHRVAISQHKQSIHTPDIDKLLTAIPPYDWTKWQCGGVDNKSCWQWNGTDRGIYLHLREHCGATAKEKKLPRYVMEWSAETLQVLLDAAIAGDGKGPIKNKHGYQSWYYRTTSRQLADDIAEIGVKCGYTTSVVVTQYPYKGKMHDYHTVHLRDRTYANVHGKHQSIVNYDGKIWCVTVPTGLFVVRRNGKTHITGNSEEQIRDMILSAFRVPGAAVGLVREMTYGSILATLAQMCSFAVNPRLAMLGQRFTKFLAARFGDDVRVWWDDCTPPDPQQVNADIQLDYSCMALSPNEIRALRGRKPWQHGGDDPMGPGPGGTVPIPLNTGDDLTELAELVPNLAGGGQEEQQPGGPGGPMGGGEGGHPAAGGLELPKPDNETDGLLNEKPVMNPGIEEPNGPPSKEVAKDITLWRYNTTTGWKRERTCDDTTANQWLARFQQDEPKVLFTLSRREPKPPKWDRDNGWTLAKSLVQKKDGPFKFASTQFNLADAQTEQLYGEPLWKRIISMANSIDENDLAADGRESTPHVTIKYGLHTANPEELTQIVRGFGPVRLRLGKTSIFPANQSNAQRGEPQYDVVKIDVVSPDLKRLNKLIADYVDHTDTHPVYQPHVTLAYVKPGMGPMYTGMIDVNGAWAVCDKLILTDKNGTTSKISLVNRTKQLVGKDKGQPCKPGETAARSGCIPGEGGATGAGRKTPPPLPGKKTGGIKQALADIGSQSFEAIAKIGNTLKHWEHVAKDWVSSGVEQNVNKLPDQMQNIVKGTWAALRLGTKGAFATYTAGQKMAEEVALAKGMTPEAASNLRSVLSTIDIATFKPVSVGIAAIAGPAVAGAASFIPIGSLTYLAYSTATNPMAVATASKNLVKKAAKRLGIVKGEAGTGLVGRVADFVGENDQRLSLLLAALDETGSLSKALRLARYAADSGKAKQHGGKWVETKGKRRTPAVDKDKGQPCERGETAASSGCIPASGVGGQNPSSKKPMRSSNRSSGIAANVTRSVPSDAEWKAALVDVWEHNWRDTPFNKEDFEEARGSGLCLAATKKLKELLSSKGLETIERYGEYREPGTQIRGPQEHAWLETRDGTIIDGTESQFRDDVKLGSVSIYSKDSTESVRYRPFAAKTLSRLAVKKKSVDKDKGQPCEQGETAVRSGCIPATGTGGNSQGSQGQAPAQTTDNKVEPLRPDDAKYMAEMCKALFDHDDPNAFANLAGVTGAEVLVGKFRDPESYNPGVNVVVKHPAFISLQYQAWVDGDGNKRFHLDEFFLQENQKGSGAATTTFANQVNSLRENGFASMDCLAAQGADTAGNPMNGYYTWPRFGFDFPLKSLDQDVWKAIENEFPLAESVLDLMQTEKGRAWWKENGVELNGAMFDLSEGSRSLQIWDVYMEERAKGKPKTKSKKMKKAQEPEQKPEKGKTKVVEMDLAPWEEEALDRAWKKIEEQNKNEEE